MSLRVVIIGIESITSESIKQSHVLHWALRNLLRPSDKLVLIHSTKHLDGNTAKVGGYTTGADIEELERTVSQTLHELLAHSMTPPLEDIQTKVEIVKGDPRDVLVEAVERYKADVVVIGSRKIGAVKRAITGSVSEYLGRNSSVSVVIVKA